MTTSPSRSKPVEITPERKNAFREFILSLPRKCSPTICGIVAPGAVDAATTPSAMEMSLNVTANTATMESSLEVSSSCIWSIDEYAELYGSDFDNVHELDHFHEYESEHLSRHFTDESERFFSQPSINPSPLHPSFGSSTAVQSTEGGENISRSTGSFIRYIDSLESNMTVVKNSHFAEQLEDYPDDEADLQVDSGNFNLKNETEDGDETTPKKKAAQMKISFVDSDFVSGTTMDFSCRTSSSGILCGGFSKFESSDLQSKYSRYLDFSPISPISRRAPLAVMKSNQVGPSSNLARLPMCSFGSHLSLNDIENLSPIVPVGLKQSHFTPTKASKPLSEAISQTECTPIGQQMLASPMAMSIDDLSAICSPVRAVLQRIPPPLSSMLTDGESQLLNQQHWDAAFQPQIPGHGLCSDAVFKTPASKPTRKRATNRRTKLVFNECTSTPN